MSVDSGSFVDLSRIRHLVIDCFDELRLQLPDIEQVEFPILLDVDPGAFSHLISATATVA